MWRSILHACGSCHFFHKKMIKYCDHASYAKYGDDSSKSDTDQLMSEEQANGSGKADIKEVETVLGEPNRFPDTVGNGLYDPVSRVGDDTHVQRHGGTNPGKDDSGGKDQKSGWHIVGRSWQQSGKKVHKTCEYRA